MERIDDRLRAEHFYDPLHGRIFSTMMRLIDRGQLANPVTLKTFFSATEEGQTTEIEDYLGELADGVISIAQAADYASTIYETHLRRELIRIGDDVIGDASHPDVDLPATHQIETAEAKLFQLAETRKPAPDCGLSRMSPRPQSTRRRLPLKMTAACPVTAPV